MTPTRRILAVILFAVVATSVYGAAATLGVGARPLAAGSAVVGDCHTGPEPTVSYIYTGDNVTGLTVTGLAPACTGGAAAATVSKADGTSPVSATGTVVASGPAASVSITFPGAGAPAVDVKQYDVVVVTP